MFTKCDSGPMGYKSAAFGNDRPYVFDEKELFR